ncbi:unnamed protein product [Ectocarpus sp. CCAP 1310/34]|nr:unnamed protein product [Ectocarpus sp. CCAP 1310/34]
MRVRPGLMNSLYSLFASSKKGMVSMNARGAGSSQRRSGRPTRRLFKLKDSSMLAISGGDLTKWKGDAIVNAANEWMLGGGGVDGAIHRAAGRQLLEACYDVEPNSEGIRCPTGEARITPGFRLPAKFVIHTVGPVYETKEVSAPLLRSAIKNSLLLCKENGVKSVAFPAISCGVYGYPAGEAAEIAIDTMLEFSEGIDLIEFVLFGKDTYNPFMKKASEKLAVVKEDSGGSLDDPNAPKASSTPELKTADEGAPNAASGEGSPSAGRAAAPTLEEKQKPEEPECTKPPAGPTSEDGDAAVEPISMSQEENIGTLDGSVEEGTEEPMSQEQTLGGLGEDLTPAHGGEPMPQAVSEGPGEDTPPKAAQGGERQVPDRKRPAPDGKAPDSSQAMETEEPHNEGAQEAGEGQAKGVEAVSHARDSSPPTEKR